ncbi:Permuted papain-like amidase enzyme, YaeF/YiiX, C92 family [anaerobic digester metagenome]
MKTLDKNTLQSGDVLHCTSERLLSRIIRKLTKGRVNHSALAIEVWGELFIIDAQKDGTNLRPISEWNKKYKYSYKIFRPTDFSTEIRSKAISKIGSTPYDFLSLIVWQPIYILTGKWHGRGKKNAGKRMYCSEYIAWLFDFDYWWQLSPQAVYNLMEEDARFAIVEEA